MYRPPISPNVLRLEESRQAPENEYDVLLRHHREQRADERAQRRQQRAEARAERSRIAHPLAALRSLMTPHRGV
jgi:hypothetical protein